MGIQARRRRSACVMAMIEALLARLPVRAKARGFRGQVVVLDRDNWMAYLAGRLVKSGCPDGGLWV